MAKASIQQNYVCVLKYGINQNDKYSTVFLQGRNNGIENRISFFMRRRVALGQLPNVVRLSLDLIL